MMKGMFSLGLLMSCWCARADDVGDVSADASAIYTGNTYHGYAEIRVDLQNRSHDRSHVVSLVYPNNSYGRYGNSISRLARTVKLAPESAETVSLLVPPLPSEGDGSIHVRVDDGHEGDIHAPNANDHCNYYSRDQQQATVFISRSLDDEAIEHLFHANHGAFTPDMAVGAPDATAAGQQATTWMPDTRRFMQTNWLELDYATPQTVSRISIYNTTSPGLNGFINLVGASGTNLATIPMASGKAVPGSAGWVIEYSCPVTASLVKTVRLNFVRAPAFNIGIDAVQISGPSGSQWAEDARASSDNSAAAAYSGGGGSPGQDPVESLRSESPVSGWSETWLAYSPFDTVALNAADMSSMSPGVFDALGNYLNAGGDIVLFGTTTLPAAWHSWAQNKLNDGKDYRVGFGHCFLFEAEDPSTLDKESIQRLRGTVRESEAYWQALPQESSAAESALPVHSNTQVPVRGIVLIMLTFVIVIGPVNLIWLNRRKRRVWMLWTIPAISIMTTMLVFVYSLLREGVTPDKRIYGLTVLDQASHHAATLGGESFYCPLTPSDGLNFEYGTEATPLVEMGYGSSGGSREVDWSQSQHFARGWVSARVPAYFHVRKSETRRERVEVSNENGTLQIVNGLGAPIKSLWLADADMNFYEANNVAAGQKAALTSSKPSGAMGESGPEGLKRDLGYGVGGAGNLGNNFRQYLQPNTYIAVLDGNPFIESALNSSSSPKHAKSVAVVFGILDSP
jgi:hypothetical protein